VTMVNESYRGRDPISMNAGNTMFNGLASTIHSYHEMAQTMKGIYQCYNYWESFGTFPNAALYIVWRKFKPEKYRGWNADQKTICYNLLNANGQANDYEISVGLGGKTRRFSPGVAAAGVGGDVNRENFPEMLGIIRNDVATLTRILTQLNTVPQSDATDNAIKQDLARLRVKRNQTEMTQYLTGDAAFVDKKNYVNDRITEMNNILNQADKEAPELAAAADEETVDDDNEVAPHDFICPLVPCAVAIPDNMPLPREYLMYEDEDGRQRIGYHVYVGVCMRPSYITAPKPALRPDELEPLMDMRCINTRDMLHIRVDPDDSFHTVY